MRLLCELAQEMKRHLHTLSQHVYRVYISVLRGTRGGAHTTGEVAPSCLQRLTTASAALSLTNSGCCPSILMYIRLLLLLNVFAHADALFITLYKGYWSGTRGSSLIEEHRRFSKLFMTSNKANCVVTATHVFARHHAYKMRLGRASCC